MPSVLLTLGASLGHPTLPSLKENQVERYGAIRQITRGLRRTLSDALTKHRQLSAISAELRNGGILFLDVTRWYP